MEYIPFVSIQHGYYEILYLSKDHEGFIVRKIITNNQHHILFDTSVRTLGENYIDLNHPDMSELNLDECDKQFIMEVVVYL